MQREAKAFAWRVLSADTLADKLAPPRDGDGSASAAPPSRPSRPPELAFHPRPRREALPGPQALSSDRDRGRVLHAMANHELLALELFALAVVRFPDLPAAHVRALVATMEDEQRHLAAYLARMAETGVALGSEPLSTFFWDALHPVDDARSYVAGLSLCLEQANLDFAAAWAVAFARVGDAATAAVLREVHDDEIVHLRRGVATFRALGGEPTFDGVAAALRSPLSPARARGPSLDRDGRRRAGFSPAFVESMAAVGGSKGRVPALVVAWPAVEDALAGRGSPRRPDLESLAVWMASRDDVVVASPPSSAWLADLDALGFPVPAFVDPDGPFPASSGVRSWSDGPWLARFPGASAWDSRRVEVHGKVFAARCLAELQPTAGLGARIDDAGVVCVDEDEVIRALPDRPALVKADLSTAGGHRVRIPAGWSSAPDAARRFVAKALLAGPVVVEPELPVVAELSIHATAEPSSVRIDGWTRFVAHRGVWTGTVLGSVDSGLSKPLSRFLHGDGDRRDAAYDELVRAVQLVALRAMERGHRGPISVDAMVLQEPGSPPRLKPISEVNPRWTMSRLAMALHARCAAQTAGFFVLWPTSALRRAGLEVPELRAVLEAALPRLTRAGRLRRGVVPANDPASADVTAWALIAPRWAEIELALAQVRERAPAMAARIPVADPEVVKVLSGTGHPLGEGKRG